METRTPIEKIFPLWSVDDKHEKPGIERYQALPTPQKLKETLLFGVPLHSSLTGQTLSDEAIQHFITQAISEVEHTLNLYITPVKFRESYDYSRHEFTWNYNWMKVNAPNILTVEKVELTFNNRSDIPGFIDFPLEFVYVQPQEATVQLVPAFGNSASGFIMSAFAGAQFHAMNALAAGNFPGGMRITYWAGFNKDEIPAALVELIENIAALKVLSLLGPILFPYNSVSVSLDGVGQSTGSFGPKHLADRIADIEKDIQRITEAVKGYYQRRWLVDFF